MQKVIVPGYFFYCIRKECLKNQQKNKQINGKIDKDVHIQKRILTNTHKNVLIQT